MSSCSQWSETPLRRPRAVHRRAHRAVTVTFALGFVSTALCNAADVRRCDRARLAHANSPVRVRAGAVPAVRHHSPAHICAGTGLTPVASGLGLPLPHLHRDWAYPCHICTGTGLSPLPSAPGRLTSLWRCDGMQTDRPRPVLFSSQVRPGDHGRDVLTAVHALLSVTIPPRHGTAASSSWFVLGFSIVAKRRLGRCAPLSVYTTIGGVV